MMPPPGSHPASGAPRFDPTRAVEFDVPQGVVRASTDRVVLVPAGVLDDALCLLPAPDGANVARGIGSACGARLCARLGGADRVCQAETEVVVAHLAGELAIAGIGSVALERWGRALLVVVSNCAISEGAALAAILEGAIGAATGREVACAVIAREGATSRVLVASRATIERAVRYLAEGLPWGDVVARLQRGQG